ncbi:sigma-70 family RNA polymerase sigma factor [Sinomicrobium kalidii]|uniref:RNA polymerase sigma factor n=1 Tax=Sinomicrobium kalidii TaxID=2900738 RepID=UPI001E4E7BD2|nr:sigma-70 family RNA polymerase sigma factor [Sinomicrobium kalidii]UGU17431.1 sigma-70 family RNA polymerase sigma factor [Sinomicrobium kalidii]
MDFNDNNFLVEQLKKGDNKAYMYLLNHYHGRLYAYAQTLTNDHTQTEDIIQNVFLKTWRSRKKLDTYFSVQSFLYKSVYNEFLSAYRKDRAVTLLEQKYMESLYQIVEETDEDTITKMIKLVKKEVMKLPPKCKQIFSLSKEDGLTNVEIAEYLDISIKTVEAQITKAFKILRKELGDKYESFLFILLHPNLIPK